MRAEVGMMDEQTRGLIRSTLTDVRYAEAAAGDFEAVVYERLMAPLKHHVGELEHCIADLEAQLAERWTPVESGERIMCACGNDDCWRSIRVGHNILEVFEDASDVDDESHWGVIDLPDNRRLCRLEVSDE